MQQRANWEDFEGISYVNHYQDLSDSSRRTQRNLSATPRWLLQQQRGTGGGEKGGGKGAWGPWDGQNGVAPGGQGKE